MGCGKTYVCNRLEALAMEHSFPFTIFDFDSFRREILSSTQNPEHLHVQKKLIEEFGEGIKDLDGRIDRKALSEQTYSHPYKLSFADGIIDRAITKELKRRIEGVPGIILIESALLAEKNQFSLVDYNVLVVRCPYEIQIKRVKYGDLPLEQIKKRIILQYSNDRKEAEAKKAQQTAGQGDLYVFNSIHDGGTNGNKDTYRLFAQIVNKSRGRRNG